MKLIGSLIVVLFICSTSLTLAAEQANDTQAAILQELRELRKEIAELKAEVTKLKARLEAREADEGSGWPQLETVAPDIEALRKIKVPENPTDDQIADYIDAIIVASKKQNVFSSTDPQVGMLLKIGRGRLNLLLDAYPTYSCSGGEFYIMEAIKKVVRQADKQLVIESLPNCHKLAATVLQMHWEKDAREILVRELAYYPDYLPTEWIEAVARLRDPNTYEALKAYFVDGSNPHFTYKAIKRCIPSLDMTESVAQRWEKFEFDPIKHESISVAMIAAGYGHLDALETLFDGQAEGKLRRWEAKKVRRVIRRHTDFRGTDKQIAEWVKKNRDSLVFDKKRKKFILPKPADKDQP